MNRLYSNLFYLIYKALESIEADFSNQTDSTRAFKTEFVISFLQISNNLVIESVGEGISNFIIYYFFRDKPIYFLLRKEIYGRYG